MIAKISVFTLAISCLITCNLCLFMDLMFQVPMQYCSLQHQTSPQDTCTTGHCFYFGSASSFFLQLFLCTSPVVYWTSTDLQSLFQSVISFCLFTGEVNGKPLQYSCLENPMNSMKRQVKEENCKIYGTTCEMIIFAKNITKCPLFFIIFRHPLLLSDNFSKRLIYESYNKGE